jgi:hypothetical protein
MIVMGAPGVTRSAKVMKPGVDFRVRSVVRSLCSIGSIVLEGPNARLWSTGRRAGGGLMAYEGRSSMHLPWLMACVASWHIAADHILIGDGRFRGEADMPRPRAAYRWIEFDPERS